MPGEGSRCSDRRAWIALCASASASTLNLYPEPVVAVVGVGGMRALAGNCSSAHESAVESPPSLGVASAPGHSSARSGSESEEERRSQGEGGGLGHLRLLNEGHQRAPLVLDDGGRHEVDEEVPKGVSGLGASGARRARDRVEAAVRRRELMESGGL
eukprot:scaffold32882_cov29-Tisochrysis_lutea.AAC.3